MPTAGLEPILRGAELRAIEAQYRHLPLMERAGAAAAQHAMRLIDRRDPVVLLAGPGNNGGDAFVAARHLRAGFFDVVTVFDADPQRLPQDAAAAYADYRAAGGTTVNAPPKGRVALAIDGLFGLGLARPIATRHAALIEWINRVDAPRLALDLPSGIDADTGAIHGDVAVHASATATFIAWKPGLLTGAGLDHAGDVSLHTLELDARSAGHGARMTWPAVAAELPPALRRLRRDVHKGTFGTLAIVGGATGMVGAALLAGRAALACGAGKVQVGLLAADAPAVDPCALELMLRTPDDALIHAGACVIGPGLGRGDAAQAVLARAVAGSAPLVLDADALNLAAAHRALHDAIARRGGVTLLTPHPAEAARLLQSDAANVQRDRPGAAQALSARLHAHVVLKGAGSVVAHPDGRYAINASGNPGLASGGTGDVLSGMIGALLAQGVEPADALRIGVCLHGAAADALVERGAGPLGLRASELAEAARSLLNARR